jgi:hypothetical protein
MLISADEATHKKLLDEARALAEKHAGDDPQFALRVLVRWPHGLRPDSAARLVIRAGALAFRLPGATADVDLARRQPLRRLVVALARRRLDAPGEALALDELITAGWPDERVRHDAAVNRVHVALTTLRNLGLRDMLVGSERGYFLNPAVPISVEEKPSA